MLVYLVLIHDVNTLLGAVVSDYIHTHVFFSYNKMAVSRTKRVVHAYWK